MGDMADGKTESDGATEGGEHRCEHGVHVGMVAVGAVVGKPAYDDSGHPVEEAAQAQLPYYALYFVNGFGDILDEEYGFLGSGER